MTALLDSRSMVLRSVETVPGAHLRSLQRISRLPLGTLRHHLGRLVSHHDVDEEQDRRFKRFYPAAMAPRTRRAWDAIRPRQTRAILEVLLEAPAIRQTVLSRRLSLPDSTAHHHIRRLKDLEIVAETNGLLHLPRATEVAALLAAVRPTFLDELTDGAIGLFDQLEG